MNAVAKETVNARTVESNKNFQGFIIEDESFNYIQRHKSDNKPNFSIWIVRERNEYDENSFSFDVNVYDEDNNERAEELEIGRLESYSDALEEIQKIVNENHKLHFIRLSDRDNI